MKLYLSFLYLIFIQWSFAQTIQLVSEDTQLPLEGVRILENNRILGTTNTKGLFEFNTPPKENIIHLKTDDYESKSIEFSSLVSGINIFKLVKNKFQLKDIVVNANKWQQGKMGTPQQTIQLSEKDIQFYASPTMADALESSSEIYVQKSQLGGGSPMLRGFAANRLLLIVDGIRMNNAIFRSGNLQNVIAIDPFTIKKTEVFAGPGSVLFGSDALGGVLSFETEDIYPTPKPDWEGKISSRYASAANEKTTHASLKLSNKKWASYSAFSFSGFGDLRMGKKGDDFYLRTEFIETQNTVDQIVSNTNPLIEKYTAYSQINFLQKIKFQPHSKINFLYEFIFSQTSDVPRYDRLLRKRNGVLRSAEWYYGPQTWQLHQLQAQFNHPNKWFDQAHLNLSYQKFKESRHDRDYQSNDKRNRFEKVNVLSSELGFIKKINSQHQFFYGTDMYLNKVGSSAYSNDIVSKVTTAIASRYPDRALWNSWGAYFRWLGELSKKWQMESGIRYNYVHARAVFDNTYFDFPFTKTEMNAGALSGSIGTVYRPNKKTSFRLNLSSGFRAPNIDDMAKVFDSEPGKVVVPNPDLQPEKLYNIEGGFSKDFGQTLRCQLTVYHAWLQDAIVRRDFEFNGSSSIIYDGEESQVQALQNASKARVYGGLLAMEFKMNWWLTMTTKINYNQGKEELEDGTDSPLRHAAPLFGKVGINLNYKKLKAQLYSVFNAKIAAENMPESEQGKDYLYPTDEQGNLYQPAWMTLNFKSQIKWSKKLMIHLGLENILDKRYRAYSSGIVAPGRNFYIGVNAWL